ncbi:threonine synthase [Desulfurispirillum indicum S5]|uniref:Threonine synthase n=1 Tax=Desulfurispirillum indicum (strain ATCC BAA-1389 / DSM 22839 / S5) TaxID=653733 RepID=E6W297_DESIS|nr:threonine synthase [Desulfurispirillum indicum]ADU65555.1 threonine synthase [Desulfurispirillum indicum S5]
MYQGLIYRFQDRLPVSEKTPMISLCEGNTPLIACRNLVEAIGNPNLEIFLKYEGLNPTGSFKDRGMFLAVAKAVEDGAKAIICASTGNTSASAAAYAARAGIKAYVLIPDGKIAFGKLSQAVMHGARVIQIDGNFDDALNLVRDISDKFPVALVNSVNPYRIEGQKTAAFEIIEALGDAPDYHVIPVGNAGNITAYWKGYREYHQAGKSTRLPKMLGFQAAGSAPIVLGHPVKEPETIATAIRIGNPASWKQAEAARDESGGLIDMVTDEEILEAYNLLARTEGVFCEPASAATIAGVIKLNNAGYFTGRCRLTCTLTGHGLKDPDTAMKQKIDLVKSSSDMPSVLAALGLEA